MKNLTNYCFFMVILVLFGCNPKVKETETDKGAIQSDYPIQPVAFTEVIVEDGFWKGRVDTATKVTIPHSFAKCEETGRVDNFIFAGGLQEGKFKGGYGFDDTDVYKIIEGASYSLMNNPDQKMKLYLDTLVSYIAAAQEDDGYLYTPWTLRGLR